MIMIFFCRIDTTAFYWKFSLMNSVVLLCTDLYPKESFGIVLVSVPMFAHQSIFAIMFRKPFHKMKNDEQDCTGKMHHFP